MKKFLVSILVAFSLLFISHYALASEKIDNFAVLIKVKHDSSINVEENITYDFDGSLMKHGIYRDIPVKYKSRERNYNLYISNISVSNKYGDPYKFKISNRWRYKRIKIGDTRNHVSGRKTYIIKYTVRRAINYFKNYDELYWNATGNEWSIPIISSSVKVILPRAVRKDKMQVRCFSGPIGSTNQCLNKFFERANGPAKEVDFNQNNLRPHEGLTVVVSFPKSLVAKSSFFQNVSYLIKDNLVVLFPILTFVFLFFLWWKNGRDPKGKKTIIARYEPPDNLTPAEIGTIINEKVDNIDLSSEIIYLATQGYVKIKQIHEKHLFLKTKDYLLEKLKSGDNLKNQFDKTLLNALFENASPLNQDQHKSIKLTKLKQTFINRVPQIQKELYETTVRKGYFPKNPAKIRNLYITIALVISIGVALLANFLQFITLISITLTGGLIFVFGFLMPKRTKKGVLAKEAILGFKEYLTVVERARLEFHNAPQKNPQLFEKFLPYAITLKVEKEWAKQFKDIYLTPPSWYEGFAGANFSTLVLVDNLAEFRNNTNHLLSSASQEAGTGASGFGGGGFSGGGFGGGGGSSW